MQRRDFLQWPAWAATAAWAAESLPKYRVVPGQTQAANPNRYPGRVISSPVKEERESVSRALAAAMKQLTGAATVQEAWRTFIDPDDVVGLKVNCSGAPHIMSHPLIVAEVAERLVDAGVPPAHIYVFERFENQLIDANYRPELPRGVEIHAMESGDRRRANLKHYDPRVFVEVDFFGEEQTRSFLSSLVSRRLTKIINLPNMKDHGAAGVTGCLKNIGYGCFSNVARSHRHTKTHTLSFIGTLYQTEPLRSKTVLHIMDGIRGVWEGGPFVQKDEYLFQPNLLRVTTDPVAADQLLLDIIEAERKRRGWPSVWDRSPEAMKRQRFVREPGHIEFAAALGLGTAERKQIRLEGVQA